VNPLTNRVYVTTSGGIGNNTVSVITGY